MNDIQQRIEEHINTISTFTSTPQKGVTRLTYSAEDLQARCYIKGKMEEYGLQVREDGLGNIFGKLEGTLQHAPSVLVGSHFDSVPNGGAFDGTAGIVAGLEVAALFMKNQLTPRYPLEIIALVEEEGTRFGSGLMGSRGLTGVLNKEEFQELKDKDGILAEEAMKKIELDPSLPKVRDPETIKAFLELHIEQGPILEEKNIPIGVVEAIVGLTQLEVTIEGQAGHAGTTPMNRRTDALVAAAEIVAQLPGIAVDNGEGTVITTGRLNVFPNGANVIPQKVIFTVDIRSNTEKNVHLAVKEAEELIYSYRDKGFCISIEQPLYMPPKLMNEKIRSLLEEKSNDLRIPYCPINSGAGHDAMVLSDFTDVGMLFVPSKKGLSHCPEEWSDSKHLAYAVQILFEAVKKLTEVDGK